MNTTIILTVNSSVNSTANDGSTYSPVPSFPVNDTNFDSIIVNDHELINTNSTADVLDSSGAPEEVVVDVPIRTNTTNGNMGVVSEGEVDGEKEVGDGSDESGSEGDGENKEDEEGDEEDKDKEEDKEDDKGDEDKDEGEDTDNEEHSPSTPPPSNSFTTAPSTTSHSKKKKCSKTHGFKSRMSYQNRMARRSVQKVFIDTTLPAQPVLADSRNSTRYSLVLFTTADYRAVAASSSPDVELQTSQDPQRASHVLHLSVRLQLPRSRLHSHRRHRCHCEEAGDYSGDGLPVCAWKSDNVV